MILSLVDGHGKAVVAHVPSDANVLNVMLRMFYRSRKLTEDAKFHLDREAALALRQLGLLSAICDGAHFRGIPIEIGNG